MTTVEWEKSTFAIYWFVILQLFLLLMLLLFLFLLILFNRDIFLPFQMHERHCIFKYYSNIKPERAINFRQSDFK